MGRIAVRPDGRRTVSRQSAEQNRAAGYGEDCTKTKKTLYTFRSMLSFHTLPSEYTPTWRKAECRITSDRPQTIDIAVKNALTGRLLGARRFANTTDATFDMAPIVRRCIRFAPQPAQTGFVSAADRKIPATIEATASDDPTQHLSSSVKVCYAAEIEAPMSSLITTMPLQRLIALGECDEIALLVDQAPQATVTAQGPAGTETRTYTTWNTGFLLFRLDTSEFPDAERLTLDLGLCGKVEYTLVPATRGARRIAWHSRAGSLEHYTFPVELTASVETQKTRIYGPEGYTTIGTDRQQLLRLRSAYESREMLEILSEILAAPEVWIVDGEGYRQVDVVSDQAVVHRHGVLSCLEIEIRPCRTTERPWN